MLVVDQLVAGYSMLPAIHGVSFEVKQGQIVALDPTAQVKAQLFAQLQVLLKPPQERLPIREKRSQEYRSMIL